MSLERVDPSMTMRYTRSQAAVRPSLDRRSMKIWITGYTTLVGLRLCSQLDSVKLSRSFDSISK
jgi:hypothetical protein